VSFRVKQGSPFLFGKIKYKTKPIFDLDKIEEYPNIRDYIHEKLDLLVPPPYIKPPKKGTVLGDVKETIRFNNVFFISEKTQKVENLLDDISFGLGEKGYYYDISLKPQKFEITELKDKLKNLIALISELEGKFEKELTDFYYPNLFNQENTKFFEISNFQATIEENEFLMKTFSPLQSMIEKINNKSDVIVEEGQNFALPEITLDVFNDYIYRSIDLFREKAKPLFDQRFFKLKKLLSKEKVWSISSRGIPLKTILEIFSLLFK
jgi:hypothetical protein